MAAIRGLVSEKDAAYYAGFYRGHHPALGT